MVAHRALPTDPTAHLEWADFPAGTGTFETAVEHGADFDWLEWQRTEQRVFSLDLLRIALRHGANTGNGVMLSAIYTVDIGRADEFRVGQQQGDELHARLRGQNGAQMESLVPGSAAAGEELDARVRASSEKVACEAEADLAKVLAAPVNPALAQHWLQLSGQLPD